MTSPSIAGVYAEMPSGQEKRDNLAQILQLPIVEHKPKDLPSNQFILAIEADNSIALHFTGRGSPKPIRVDFLTGATAHRRQFGGGKSQLIAKAVGIKTRFRPHVLDLTAGLGQDAFVLATLGCSMSLVERVGVVFHLLRDGLDRGLLSEDYDLRSIISNMTLVNQNALDYLKTESSVDVIYLDPMFPEREKKAKVKKSMTAFHSIVGEDNDAGELLALALAKAKYRVVIKRPRKALSLAQQYPLLGLPEAGLVIEGKSSRYDIYPILKMPEA